MLVDFFAHFLDRNIVARGLFPWPEQRALYDAAVASLGATPRRGYASALRALAQFDARGQVAAIRRPTLVVAGDRDTMVPLGPKLRLAAAIPGAQVERVSHTGRVLLNVADDADPVALATELSQRDGVVYAEPDITDHVAAPEG